MGELRNCDACGRLFVSSGVTLCPSCFEERERHFEQTRAWLEEHPGGLLSEAAVGTGVPMGEIIEFARQGRLMFTKVYGLSCERCGCAIQFGRLCEECERAVAAGAADLAKTPSAQDTRHLYHSSERMRGRRRDHEG